MGEGNKRKARQEEPPAVPSHRLLTSDELGLLKVTEVPAGSKWEGTAAKQRWCDPDKQHLVTRLQVHCPDWEPENCLVAAARGGGRVTLHSGADGSEAGAFRSAPPATTSGRTDTSLNELRGLRFATGAGQHQLLLVTATAGGHVAVHRSLAEGAGGAGGVVRTWEDVQRLQTVGDLQAMDVSASGRHVAVGGDGHQLRVWDLAAAATAAAAGGPAPEPLFAGKAGKPSRSGLQDLAHVTAVSYVPGRDDQLVLVGTAKHKLWLYDMRAGRKPQADLVWSEGRITALLPEPDGVRMWVANGRGQIEALDLRQAPSKIAMGHALKGSAGSIRSLSLHPTEPLIASVSLDRHLRVHSTTTRTLLTKVYLKLALTGVAWLPPQPEPQAPAPAVAGEGEEQEEERDVTGAAQGGAEDGEEQGDPEEEEEEEAGAQRAHKQKAGRSGKAAGGGGTPRRTDGKQSGKAKLQQRDKMARQRKDQSQKRRRREGAGGGDNGD